MSACESRFRTIRRPTLEVRIGAVGVGGSNPIRIQSMTTSDTQDVEATVRQSIALAEVGCEIVRITAPNVQAARCLRDIRAKFTAAGFGAVPLVADIHFLPQAAMEAVEHVEKIRVNPGNYADKKKFAVREYTQAEYDSELQRLHEAFSPLVRRCRELGRALRIGTNHGSLSDRIMNRYGDTPLGMVESALEFLRIAQDNHFRQLILSMKASNPKVMIEAYRLLVERMDREDMHYPLHLGVTEAGDGEDGRIKSAIGIGSLLLEGLGDTIRVSLTEDSVYEIPVARAIADKAMSLWGDHGRGAGVCAPDGRPGASLGGDSSGVMRGRDARASLEETGGVDTARFVRRETSKIVLGPGCEVGPEMPPRVIVRVPQQDLGRLPELFRTVRPGDTPVEGVLVPVRTPAELAQAHAQLSAARQQMAIGFAVFELSESVPPEALEEASRTASQAPGLLLVRRFGGGDAALLERFAALASRTGCHLACDVSAAELPSLLAGLDPGAADRLIFTCSAAPGPDSGHALGAYRRMAAALAKAGLKSPIWVRNTAATAIRDDGGFLSRLLEASMLTGGLLCDGAGDLVSVETESDPARSLRLAYNLLQGAGARISKTEFVACPSCGRTLFDLQSTTQRIRAKTGHLKGVKIAIMGCIVNGPGEMADANFGYVGGAPGKINLYVGKQCVQYNIPQDEADQRLIALIREHGKWTDPEPATA